MCCRAIQALLGVGGTAFLAFALTLAPTVSSEDSGELIAAAYHFGVPHPPGYPLWTMLCGLFLRIVPIDSAALACNLFSALCSAAAATVLYAAVRETVTGPAGAAGAALIWVLGRWSWSQSVITEVYALNHLLTAGLLWCALRWRRTRDHRLLLAACLLLGLGLANQQIIAFAALALTGWILLLQPELLKRGRLIAAAIVALLVGLLPYTYLPIRAAANPAVNWGNPSNAERFWNHLTRQQYGAVGPTRVEEGRSVARFGGQLRYAVESVVDDMTPGLAVTAAAGLVLLARKDRALLLLCGLWLVTTMGLFVLLANFDLDRTSRWAMRVFLIPCSMILALPLAQLLESLGAGLTRLLPQRKRVAAVCAFLVCMAGSVVQLTAHWRQCDYSNYWYAHDHAKNLLASMQQGAIIFPSGDHTAFPLVYVTTVEGQRPDVLLGDIYGYVSPELVADRPPEQTGDDVAWVAAHTDRPVYFSTKRAPPLPGSRLVRRGMLYRLVRHGEPTIGRDTVAECTYRNLVQPSVIDLGASHILSDHAFFQALAALERGDAGDAREAFERAGDYGQRVKEVANNIGSAWAEHGHPEEAVGWFEKAAALDPHYALPRWNIVHLSKANTDWSRARTQLEELIRLDAENPRTYAELGFLLAAYFDDKAGAAALWQESIRRDPAQADVIAALAEYFRTKCN